MTSSQVEDAHPKPYANGTSDSGTPGPRFPSTSRWTTWTPRGPSFRLTADEYLTVNFTSFLESTSPYQVCNTTIGCVTVSTYSNTFRSYMQNMHIIIQDRSVMRCMDRAGWDVDDDHVIPFDNADLITCDERMKVANEVCPAKNTGASDDLYAMWDTGLLKAILPDSFAQGLRLQVERARDRAPECLCAAGFEDSTLRRYVREHRRSMGTFRCAAGGGRVRLTNGSDNSGLTC